MTDTTVNHDRSILQDQSRIQTPYRRVRRKHQWLASSRSIESASALASPQVLLLIAEALPTGWKKRSPVCADRGLMPKQFLARTTGIGTSRSLSSLPATSLQRWLLRQPQL